MHARTATLFLALVTVLGTSCRSMTTAQPRTQAGYQRELGVATEHDIRNSLLGVMKRTGFDIVRYNGPPQIYAESQYRSRYPFADEQEMGITAARNRIILTARRVPQRTHMGDLYDVEIDIQNEVQVGSGAWTSQVRTQEFLNYAKKLADDLEHEVRSAVRVFEIGRAHV